MKPFLFLFFFLLIAPQCLFAAPSDDQMQQEMMMKMQEAGKPSSQHKNFQPLVGKWKATSSWRMSPDQPAEESVARVTREWVLGGLFVQENYEDRNEKQPFSGLGMLGYDKVMNEYTSTWFDTMSTSTWQARGSTDGSGKRFRFQGKGSCPMTGGVKEVRSELQIVSRDKNIYRMFDETPDGKEFQSLEIVYERIG